MGVAEYTYIRSIKRTFKISFTRQFRHYLVQETNFVNEDHLKLINETKNNIWFPNSYEDFEKLEPELVYTDSDKDRQSAGS